MFSSDLHLLSAALGSKKSNDAAKASREKGNVHFRSGNIYAALVAYNESICQAEKHSSELGLAFGNRSAVYMECKMYRKCLENIELARVRSYPVELMSKLKDRQERCMKLMAVDTDREDAKGDFFALSHDPNAKIPFIVDSIKIDQNPNEGQHIVTTKDLKAGDVIALEEALFKTINFNSRFSRCANCLKCNLLSLIPCEICDKAMYCSEQCQAEHADGLHKAENLETAEPTCMQAPTPWILQAAAIAGNYEYLQKLLSDDESRTVFDFSLTNSEDRSYKKKLLMAINSLPIKTDAIDKMFYNVFLQFMLQFLRFENAKISSDEAKLFMKSWRKFLFISENNEFKLMEQCLMPDLLGKATIHEYTIGVGLFPFASLIKQSGEPNVQRITVDNKLAIVVKRPIKAGDQIFIKCACPSADLPNCVNFSSKVEIECPCGGTANAAAIKAKFEKKGKNFIESKIAVMSACDAIAQFEKNCDYINKHAMIYPSYEIDVLIKQNDSLLRQIVADQFVTSETE